MEVPEPRSLDTLIRCLAGEMSEPLPQLAYEQGCWCILPRREPKAHETIGASPVVGPEYQDKP
jgi:hypothetical protein